MSDQEKEAKAKAKPKKEAEAKAKQEAKPETVTFEKPFEYAIGGTDVKTFEGKVEDCPGEVVACARKIGGFLKK